MAHPFVAGVAVVLLFNVASAGSTKRGLADDSAAANAPLLCGDLALVGRNISWTYSWGLRPSNTTCPEIAADGFVHFEPMVWGAFAVPPTDAFTASATHMLGFNEPNGKSQSNLTPQKAAALWPQVAAAAKAANLKLVAPVPAGSDTQWLTQFFALCGCEADIDAVALHPYVGSGAALTKALDTWSVFKKPLHVTEFNNGNGMKNATAAEHLAYMREALPILEADPRVVRYAWMAARDKKVPGAALFVQDSSALTPLGQFYFSYNHTAATAAAAATASSHTVLRREDREREAGNEAQT